MPGEPVSAPASPAVTGSRRPGRLRRRRLTEAILAAAAEVGFDRCAVAPVASLPAADRLRRWLADGMHGDMAWMARDIDRRTDPARVVPGARSVVVVALGYHTADPTAGAPDRGRVSCYAWGDEYHRVLGKRLRALYGRIRRLAPEAEGRWYVDTGPVLEKAWAQRAGLGWIGKHTNLIAPDGGSWFFLGVLILNLELEPGRPHADRCGTCTRCMAVCPTAAIVAPYVLDARRCIAYLTIENRGPIPREFRRPMGNRVFGCDDCQEVCPWNRFARLSRDAQAFAPRPGNREPRLVELLRLDEEGFRRRFRNSPVRRARRAGFLRNVAVALGNSGDPGAVPALAEALADREPLVRGHVAWALGELGGERARQALRRRLATETDPWVREETAGALARLALAGS